MKLLHQLGHNQKWALDAYFQNKIGDGFIFGAFNFLHSAFTGTISKYKPSQYLGLSLFDAQFYANKDAQGGKLDSYPFHPLHAAKSEKTDVGGIEQIFRAVSFQEEKDFFGVIIPNFYTDDSDSVIKRIKNINKRLSIKKDRKKKYYLTVPIAHSMFQDNTKIEKILHSMTDRDIIFDGYYLACEGKIEFGSKLCVDVRFMNNMHLIFKTLNRQGFETIFPYANFDSIVYYALSDIDYISLGTYENLRKFSNIRYLGDVGGGPSKGWYFSEKLLNFIKAQSLEHFHQKKCIHTIANEDNMFSDVILQPHYNWNTHKAEVHKNYLLAISKIFAQLSPLSPQERTELLLRKIQNARDLYERLRVDYRIQIVDEGSERHLGEWYTFLNANAPE